MADNSMASILEEDLCCPVCLEVFRDPVLLSCRHNFCKECLKRWWGERTIYDCPLCKRRSSEDNAPLNRFLGTVCQFFLRNKYQEKLKVCKEVQVKFAQTAEHIEVQARHTDRQFKKLHQFLAEEEEARLAALKEEKKQKIVPAVLIELYLPFCVCLFTYLDYIETLQQLHLDLVADTQFQNLTVRLGVSVMGLGHATLCF
uniref:RING-type domain-containing protein n=1 Tax=Pundamilia nyererei TaxID=303518 RepID=A0A3B4GZG5_9CICH